MKKSIIKTLAVISSLFVLSACSVETNFQLFNYDLGIDLGLTDLFAEEVDYSIVQLDNKIIWGSPSSDEEYTFSIYKNDSLLVEDYKYHAYPLINGLDVKGDKYRVRATSKVSGITYDSKLLKIKSFGAIPLKSEAEIRFVGKSGSSSVIGEVTTKGSSSKTEMKKDGYYKIGESTNSILIENFEEGNFKFQFSNRTNPIYIYLSNVKLDNVLTTKGSLFQYEGSNKKAVFNFIIEGINELGGGVNAETHHGIDTISLPNVSFQGDGTLNVIGGHSKTHTSGGDDSDTGFAVKATHIYNFMSEKSLTLIGGNGGPASYRGAKGGNGHYPINSDVMIKSHNENAIGIKSGNGGNGADNTGVGNTGGAGGDVFAYSYLTKSLYVNYKQYFVDMFEDPIPGVGGKGYTSDRKGSQGQVLTA